MCVTLMSSIYGCDPAEELVSDGNTIKHFDDLKRTSLILKRTKGIQDKLPVELLIKRAALPPRR